MQRRTWSCGAASVVNAFKCFGINIAEKEIIPIAGTIPPSKCKHCKELKLAKEASKCKARWTCACERCQAYRKASRIPCESGTSYDGILAAVRCFGADTLSASEYKCEKRAEAWLWLHGALVTGRVVILASHRWSHWILACGASGDRVTVFDPQKTIANKRENGVHVLSKEQLMKIWYNGCKARGDEKSLYAISIGKK